jgi:hypothetical protein
MKIGKSVYCQVCERRKKPIGRSAPIGMDLCDEDCKGYRKEPHVGSLWPGESEGDFGYPVGNDGVELRPRVDKLESSTYSI